MKPEQCFYLGLAAVLLAGGCRANRQDRVCRVQPTAATVQQSAPARTTPAEADLAKLLVSRGKLYYKQGKLHSAATLFKTATEIDPRNNEAWYFLDRVRREIDGGGPNELHRRGIRDEVAVEPNQSWQPTPGSRLAALYVSPARSGCTLRWA